MLGVSDGGGEVLPFLPRGAVLRFLAAFCGPPRLVGRTPRLAMEAEEAMMDAASEAACVDAGETGVPDSTAAEEAGPASSGPG